MQSHKLMVQILFALAMLVGLTLIGCEGEQGPQGPQGPAGPPGPGLEAGFLGDNANSCGHCHSTVTGQWLGTGHATATASLTGDNATNGYCLACHTTGFDDEYDHDGNLVSEGPDNTGYDDRPIAQLANVQCESCHGAMGSNPATHSPQIAGGLSGATCGNCHEQNEEVAESGHGTAIERAGGEEAFVDEFGRSSCWSCHISEGFIMAKDADYAGADLEMKNAIGCATCHDPHNAENEYQLRTLDDATSAYSALSPAGFTITGYGKGQLCVQCHHARRNEANILGQINNGSAHPGPHESPQGDMVSGQGSYEIPGLTYERDLDLTHGMMENVCVDCHMYSVARAPGVTPEFGHKFEADVRRCQTCHPGTADFDVNGVQTEIHDLIVELSALLPHDSTGAVMHSMDTLNWTRPQREAGYAYFFVEADGSHGVHNPTYARSLLENAIDHLNP